MLIKLKSLFLSNLIAALESACNRSRHLRLVVVFSALDLDKKDGKNFPDKIQIPEPSPI